MDQKLKTEWVAALRSGKYVQGRRQLETPSGANCCLGVLCRVAKVEFNPLALSFFYEGYPMGVELSIEFAAHCGVSSVDEAHLIAMNDTGNTFEQIADYIEKHL